MKITKSIINQFEYDRRAWGARVALSNFQWQLAAGLLKDIGITTIKTSQTIRKRRAPNSLSS